MYEEDRFDCEICKTQWEDKNSHMGTNCPKCGACHDYNEGFMIRLGKVVSFDLEKGEVTYKIK